MCCVRSHAGYLQYRSGCLSVGDRVHHRIDRDPSDRRIRLAAGNQDDAWRKHHRTITYEGRKGRKET